MDSPQSVVSPFKSLSVTSEPAKLSDFLSQKSGSITKGGANSQRKEETADCNMDDGFIGVLEVFVHQARDIQNICIYHKQDVYAKVCLTSDPETTVSTKIINGGGKNPVFNDNLHLNVRTVESSLKCEVWMLSRVKNYLEDQLLGFALVPMNEILASNGKLEKEFILSSTDLFHSPAGFVQLSVSYSGASPEIVAIPSPNATLNSEISPSDTSDLSKIEFPDPKVVNENHMMVSEYFGIQCSSLDSQSSESYGSSDNELSSEIGVQVVESFSAGTVDSVHLQKPESPQGGVPVVESFSTGTANSVRPQKPESAPGSGVQVVESLSTDTLNSIHLQKPGSPPGSVSSGRSSSPVSSQVSDNLPASKAPSQVQIPEPKDKAKDNSGEDGETDSSADAPVAKPVVRMEPKGKMVQQDIVDMYMKSMQQFTESLAKMKLPMDIGSNEQANSENSSSDQKLQAPKSNGGSRVFYGSRAFF